MRRLITIDMDGRAPARGVRRPDVLNERRPLQAAHRSTWSYVFAICTVTVLLAAGAMRLNAEALAPFPNDPNLGRAIAVQAANQGAFLATPSVNGVGIGHVNGSLALVVLVSDTNHVAELPSSVDGLPVNVQLVGTIHAGECGGSNPQSTYPLPVPLGVSGGNAILFNGCCASGTIGFKVRDNNSGVVGWISNNHVVGHGADGCPSTAPVGIAEYQPGPIDTTPVCSAGQPIGTLNRAIPINFGGGNNVVDCGFVQSSDLAISSTILNLGPQVNSVVPAFVGQAVQKNGRTTDCTEGIVQAVNLTVAVNYSESAPCATTCGTAIFTNQIMISPISSSAAFAQPGDSGSPIVDAANNAVGLLFAGDAIGDAFGNPIGAVLSALNVSLASNASSQVVTRTSSYWFKHGYSSDTNCATLLAAIQHNGSAINLGFVTLPSANRTADNIVDANDTFVEALSFFWRANGRTGEPGGSQSAKLKASALCTARKKLAVELIAAIANTSLLNTFPGNATYNNGGTITNFPPDLISQAQLTGAGFDVVAIRAMTVLLKKFNISGVTNDLIGVGLNDCSQQASKVLKPISQDPMLQSTCPGVNNSCIAAQVVAFPNSSNPFAAAVFTTSTGLGGYTNNMPVPSCNAGGRDAVWQIPPSIGTAGRQFTVYTAGSNFNTMLAVWSGTCSNLTQVTCADLSVGIGGESLSFNTDGINTFFIVGEGAVGQYGKLKIRITSP